MTENQEKQNSYSYKPPHSNNGFLKNFYKSGGNIFVGLGEKLNPAPLVGSLSLSDTAIKFLSFKNEFSSSDRISLRLPPGIIENGEIKDEFNFTKAVISVRKQLGRRNRKINVVLNIPQTIVFTQSFNMPPINDSEMDEAIKLNLQMVSPINFEEVIYGYQKIGEVPEQNEKIEYLGAFAKKDVVLRYINILKNMGFAISAVEFPALSIARILEKDPRFERDSSYILLDIAPEGISLMAIKNLSLYFNHFHTWKSIREEIGERELTKDGFKNFIIKEIKKVGNFFSSRASSSISSVVLASPDFKEEITNAIKTNFGFNVVDFSNEKINSFDSSWYPAVGSALRGLIPRYKDDFMSLTNDSVKMEFFHNRVFNLMDFWKKILLTVFSFLLIIFLVTDVYLRSLENNYSKQALESNSKSSTKEVSLLEEKAKKFNQNVDLLAKIKSKTSNTSNLMSTVIGLAIPGIYIDRLYVEGDKISLQGNAASENEILSFKDEMVREPNFSDVSLPLTEIRPTPNGGSKFSISFRIKTKDF